MAYFDDTRVESLLTAYENEPSARAALGEGLAATYNRIQSTLLQLTLQRGGAAAALPDAAKGLIAKLPGGERLLQRLPGGRAAAAVAATAVLAAAAALALTRPGRGLLHQAYPGLSTAMFRMEDGKPFVPKPLAIDQLDEVGAAALVRAWQAVKYGAMGPNHDTAGLSAVLAEPLLSQFRQKVDKFAEQGWFIR